MDKTPIILTGPPGCGKSYWIQKYAEKINKQLFVCPCRKDRTLREGRQKLHIWARRTEPAILWLEGADDLTPEAQAFLRRILETHSSNVLFILECRDAGKLQEPVRSRCLIKKMNQPSWNELEDYIFITYKDNIKSNKLKIQEIKDYLLPDEYSFRRVNHCINLQIDYPEIWNNTYKHRLEENSILQSQKSDNLINYIKKAYNPDNLIKPYLTNLDNLDILKDYGKCNELSGSLWAFLGSALHRCETTTNKY